MTSTSPPIPKPVSGACGAGVAEISLPAGADFDYIVSAEDMKYISIPAADFRK